MRERVVTITSGQNGLRYSVFAKSGAVLAAALDEAQLAEQHPDVYEQVRPVSLAKPPLALPSGLGCSLDFSSKSCWLEST